MAENPKAKSNIRKVYISDSPVQDDNIEYDYVSSDVEEDLNRTQKIIERVKTPGLPKMPKSQRDNTRTNDATPKKQSERSNQVPAQELSEEDELAKEAQYQNELQDRLKKTTLDEEMVSNHSDNENSEETPQTTDPSNSGPEEDILEWKNPPANPFLHNEEPVNGDSNENYSDSARYDENPPVFADEEVGYKAVERQQTPGRSHINNQVANPRFYNIKHSNTSYAVHPNTKVSNSYSSNHQALSFFSADAAAKTTQTNFVDAFDHHSDSTGYHYNKTVQTQEQDMYGFAHPNTAEYTQYDYHSNSKTFQQQAYELEQRQLMLQQQHEMQQQPIQMQSPLQRNAPVMYMQNPTNPNEYYVVTPQDSSQQNYVLQGSPDHPQPVYQSPRVVGGNDDTASLRTVKGLVAPKPIKPAKNYVEKNKHRAVGQHSAKPGYSDRLVIKRQEQEQMKDWAPGMIIPRKKAASADDAARPPDREIPDSAEDMWSKRSRELANAKQAKLSGAARGKKLGHSKPSSLTRFPSDNSLVKKKNSRPPIPPINQPKALKSYSENYQPSSSQRSAPERPDALSNSYPNQGHPVGSGNWVLQPGFSPQPNGIVYRQGDKVFLPVEQIPQSTSLPQLYQAHSPNNFQPYQPDPHQQMSPVLNQQFAVPVSGPPSGGYHHNSRHKEINAGYMLPHPPNNPPRNPYQPEQTAPMYSQPPPPPIRQPLVPLQQQAHQHLPYAGGNAVPPQMNHVDGGQPHQHPAYDYSGYMGYSEPVEPLHQQDVSSYESEPKPYEGSSYSSPQPQPQHHNYNTTVSKPTHERDKLPLNPYAAIPPIYSSGVKPPQKNPGSYVDAYQKEKDRANGRINPNYKVYTMKDYKNLKLEYKLGGLGPSQDPEIIKEKNDQRMKQLKYAKEVVDAEKKKPHVSPRRKSVDEEPPVQQISSRQLAVEYAKNVPKPKAYNRQYNGMQPAHQDEIPLNTGKKIPGVQALSQSPDYQPADQQANHWNRRQPDVQPLSQIHLQDLEDLQRRHEEERMAVAEIQYKMQQAA